MRNKLSYPNFLLTHGNVHGFNERLESKKRVWDHNVILLTGLLLSLRINSTRSNLVKWRDQFNKQQIFVCVSVPHWCRLLNNKAHLKLVFINFFTWHWYTLSLDHFGKAFSRPSRYSGFCNLEEIYILLTTCIEPQFYLKNVSKSNTCSIALS